MKHKKGGFGPKPGPAQPSNPSVYRKAARASIWQLTLAAVIALTTGVGIAVPTTYYFVRSLLTETFLSTFAPFGNMMAASEFRRQELYEEAIAEYEEGFQAIVSQGDFSRIVLYVSGFLDAVAYSNDPLKHKLEFERCRQLLKDLAAEDSHQSYAIGWYLLRTHEPQQAKEYFDKCLTLASAKSSRQEMAYANFGKAHHALCMGDANAAYDFNEEALKVMPNGEFSYFEEERINQGLTRIYPEFKKAIGALTLRFGTENDADSKPGVGTTPLKPKK
jgi:tetratricopeptide (TPR) repeat protein